MRADRFEVEFEQLIDECQDFGVRAVGVSLDRTDRVDPERLDLMGGEGSPASIEASSITHAPSPGHACFSLVPACWLVRGTR